MAPKEAPATNVVALDVESVEYWRARCRRCEAAAIGREVDDLPASPGCGHPLDRWIAGVVAIGLGLVVTIGLLWWAAG